MGKRKQKSENKLEWFTSISYKEWFEASKIAAEKEVSSTGTGLPLSQNEYPFRSSVPFVSVNIFSTAKSDISLIGPIVLSIIRVPKVVLPGTGVEAL